jgi:hypothetical protein
VIVAEPPRIVVESHGSCSNGEHVAGQLLEAIAAARAPGHAWTLTMRVEATTAHALRAEGEITDENGFRIADRVLSVPAGDCSGLARAVGVWASLVLDEEMAHARSQAEAKQAKTVPPVAVAAPAESLDVLWPAPAPTVKAPPESDWYLHHDDGRTFEVGAAAFLMAGAGAGAMAGASPYFIIEAGDGIFLRPSFAIGQSVSALNQPPAVSALLLAGRFDTCLRIPGLYTQNRGMQLDMCGGTDIGFLDVSSSDVRLPFVSLGPSLDLRGELGSVLSASLRGGAGLNATSGTTGGIYQPLWSGRLELAFSWKVK